MIYATVFYSVQLDFFLSPLMNNAWKSFLCWRLEHKLFFFFRKEKNFTWKEIQGSPASKWPASQMQTTVFKGNEYKISKITRFSINLFLIKKKKNKAKQYLSQKITYPQRRGPVFRYPCHKRQRWNCLCKALWEILKVSVLEGCRLNRLTCCSWFISAYKLLFLMNCGTWCA